MAFKGHLEDLSIVDVLQLLHISKREGVLLIEGLEGSATLVLKNGYIIGAHHPSKEMNVGRILLDLGAVEPQQIAHVVERQQAPTQHKPLITSLVEQGALNKDVGWKALERLIEETVVELVTWKKGTFSFELGTVNATDDFCHFPQTEVFREVGLDIQHTLMEAMQILDERKQKLLQDTLSGKMSFSVDNEQGKERDQRSTAPAPPLKGKGVEISTDSTDVRADIQPPAADFKRSPSFSKEPAIRAREMALEALRSETEESLLSKPYMVRKVLLFSRDAVLKNIVVERSQDYDVDVFYSAYEPELIEQLKTYGLQGLSPVVVVDLKGKTIDERWKQRGQSLVTRIGTTFPDISLIALGEADLESALSMGVRAIIPRKVRDESSTEYREYAYRISEAVFKCVVGIYQHRTALFGDIVDGRKQITMLKKRVQEFKFRGESPEISLVVLKYLADFVDRCVIFLVCTSDLVGLGAFGINVDNKDQSEMVMQIKISISPDTVISGCLQGGRVFLGECNDYSFKHALYRKIGKPASELVVLLPLKAGKRTVALIYGDFGVRKPTPLLTDALEILALHAGLALEVALLRKQKKETTTQVDEENVSQIKRKSWMKQEANKKVTPRKVVARQSADKRG